MNTEGTNSFIRRIGDVNTVSVKALLTEAGQLDARQVVSHVDCQAVGTGQMSQSYRLAVDVEGNSETLNYVLKVASEDEKSRAAGMGLGAYLTEVLFYQQLEPTLASKVSSPIPRCYSSAIERETGWFYLLLEDLSPASQGDELLGSTRQQAEIAVATLARLHAPFWNSKDLAERRWLNNPSPLNGSLAQKLWPEFERRYGELLTNDELEACKEFVPLIDDWRSLTDGPKTLQHGDYRLDNLLFADDGTGATESARSVDFQVVSYGPALRDLGYFIGCSLTSEDRQEWGSTLVDLYCDELAVCGIDGVDKSEMQELYRLAACTGLAMSIPASVLVQQTERGDKMFATCLGRQAQQVIALRSLEAIKSQNTPNIQAAVHPAQAADENPHPQQTDDPLWSESWYFDFHTTEDGPGGYFRLAVLPHKQSAWLTAMVVRQGQPTLRIVDFELPLPQSTDTMTGNGISFGRQTAESVVVADTEKVGSYEFRCKDPLSLFSVSVGGISTKFNDCGDMLKADANGDGLAELKLSLDWITDGESYQYRQTTRYEVPCKVVGQLVIDGEEFEVDGYGQRDHSWSSRDWWSLDWSWSAGRLSDGQAMQVTEVRIPGRQSIVMGYDQPADGPLQELTLCSNNEQVRADGVVQSTQIELPETGLTLKAELIAGAPIRLEDEQGRVANMMRGLFKLKSADGRDGLSWLEWNHVQPAGDR